ncbi:MAG: CDP-alcohol phosphatidyltransferase family protein [Victivallaceae bacterium]|nr:CDP-alcohol phosphatidyltransferase family protein [Victivallaceae bacterium]
MKLPAIPRGIAKAVPNFLTLCNSFCGFAAIICTLRAYESPREPMSVFMTSAILIFCAMIFDAFDGLAARLLNAGSEKGIQMDSLSDMVTFGVAPAVLVSIMTHSLRDRGLLPAQEIIVYVLCAVYIGGAALRLATYNVKAMRPGAENDNHDYFSGLPSPGAAAGICVAVFFASSTGIDLYKTAFVLPIYAAVLGLLMVSHIPYLHVGRWIFSLRYHPFRLMFFLALLIVVAVLGRRGTALVVTGYILSGPVMMILARCMGNRAK